MKALLLENIHPGAVTRLEEAGFEVELRAGSLSGDELMAALDGVHLLGIRSNSHVTAEILEKAPSLVAVGCFCIGTNQIDLAAAAARNVAVFNAPFSNTRSVVELVIAEIIVLARRLGEKNKMMHAGIWDKSAAGSHEVRGRTLGIIGYGNIGSQLSVVAEALGLRVIYYDLVDRLPFGNAQKMPTMEALLAEADVVSLHVDGRPGNAGFFGNDQFKLMKPRSLFINAARGMTVDTDALREHIVSGHIAGAALDVFPIEPKAQGDPFENALVGLDNVIMTPHVGGSTAEAQHEIGQFVSGKLIDYVRLGSTYLSVNFPQAGSEAPAGPARVTHLHENVPGVIASINAILVEAGENTLGQSLSTKGDLGYVVSDLSAPLSATALEALQAIPHTRLVRALTL